MEIQCNNPSLKVRARKKLMPLDLEDYMDFLLSHSQLHPTISFLNQIVAMHGFKIIRKPKNEVTEAVKALTLVEPWRSTLNDNISSMEFVALEDVIADLKDLNWQECCVTSIQTLNSCKPTEPKGSDPRGVGDVCGGDRASSSCVVGSESGERLGKLVPKSKRKRLNAILGDCGGTHDGGRSSGCVSVGSFGSC
ncbi:uncharacterized protein LOC132182919 [Corylus avellana]|uniref:uncharacterized protein LOC132182919 n=1 Tax=Corylus avellana TaxID=13451 RepID=UPI00286CF87B|nr:uncharacterized protein LOC132182919 [Corylus avellana]